ncbi:MAG: zinc ribbon domain-containing protein [Phycisphaerales bacterium]|nr:zinc ribbon domain-containing protein [Phycisphaerales bacterium]
MLLWNWLSNLQKSRLTKRAPDAGDSAAISSIFHALAFFWLDGFAVPAPAQVTQAVRRLALNCHNLRKDNGMTQRYCKKCGNAIQPKDLYCVKCGSPLDSKNVEVEHTESVLPANSLECPYCGNECKFGVTVCRGCQAEIRYSPTFSEYMGCGFFTIILGIVGFLIIKGALNWLFPSIEINSPQYLVCGIFVLLFVAGIRLASAILKNPRFIRNGYWKEVE